MKRIDLSGCLRVLDSLIGSRERAMRFRDRVDFDVDGYNDDPRELFEVPEIRTFVRELDAKWPYWFFFLSKASEALIIEINISNATGDHHEKPINKD